MIRRVLSFFNRTPLYPVALSANWPTVPKHKQTDYEAKLAHAKAWARSIDGPPILLEDQPSPPIAPAPIPVNLDDLPAA